MNTEECGKCGIVHERCRAHNRQQLPCGRRPMRFQGTCDVHGAKSAKSLQAAKRREIEALVAQHYKADPDAVLAYEGIKPVEDPLYELSKLATAAKSLMAGLGARLNALESFELNWNDAKGQEQLASQMSLYERAIDRTARLMDMLVKAGFESRRVEVDEKIANEFGVAIREILRRLELTPTQQANAPVIIGEVLNAIESSR